MDRIMPARVRVRVKRIFNNFLIGTLGVLPIVVVAQIVAYLADLLLGLVFNVHEYTGNYGLTFLAFALAFAFLSYIGHSLNRRRRSLVLSLLDLGIANVPFLNTVYRITQRLIDMFRTRPEEGTREVVYVEYPKEGVWQPAYVTNREGDRYVLYIPSSPIPTNGFTVIVHESKVVKSALEISEATGFLMSVGTDFPKAGEVATLPR
jgi:uncharacterized membrane protein